MKITKPIAVGTNKIKSSFSKTKIAGSNKSLEKYIAEKIKDIESDKNNFGVVKTEADLNTLSQIIKNNSTDYFNTGIKYHKSKPKMNSSFSENKSLKNYIDNKVKNGKKINSEILYTTPNIKNNNNKDISENILNKSEISNSPRHSNEFNMDYSPINNPKFETIKKSLIELVNETKDKSSIIREMDHIYKNILKANNPVTQIEEDSHLNFTRCMSNFALNENNMTTSNFNNISNVSNSISQSASKQTVSNPNIPQSEDASDSLRKENSILKKKFDDYDKKLEEIIKENDELKLFIYKKSDHIKLLEDIIKGFHKELEDVKRKQDLNSLLITSNNTENKNCVNNTFQIKIPTKNNFEGNNNFRSNSRLNSIYLHKHKNIADLNNSKNIISSKEKINSQIEEESNDDKKNIYYFPKKVNSEIFTNNLKKIHKIHTLNEFSEEKFDDSINDLSYEENSIDKKIENISKNSSKEDEEEENDDGIYILSDD